MINQQPLPPTHFSADLADYVLELLPQSRRRQIEQHLAVCADCRAAVQAERHIGTAVQATLRATPIPTPAQLRRRMPTLPQAVRPTTFLRPLFATAIIAFLFIASVTISQDPYQIWPTGPISTALAATATSQPTATLSSPPAVLPTPIPAATPIAQAVPQLAPAPAVHTN